MDQRRCSLPRLIGLKTLFLHKLKGVTTTLGVVVMLVLTAACSSSLKSDDAFSDAGDSTIVMKSYDVVTLVSDSGITRYRVATPEWLVYDKSERPCWKFPQGIHLEQFNKALKVFSQVDANQAIYYVNEDMWVLSDSVRATNVDNEYFETNKLILEQQKDSIYTDQFVRVTQKDRVIEGVGMRANQRLSRYVIEKIQGIIPLDDEEETASDSIQ